MNSPYIKQRFVIDGVVKKLYENIPVGSNLKIYTEKLNSIKPPYLFVSIENAILRKETSFMRFKDYLVLIYGRFEKSTYAELDDLACWLYDWLEYIYLPVANSLKEGPQPEGLMLPVEGTDMKHHIENSQSYSELEFYVNYTIQIFREKPFISKMKEKKIIFRKGEK